MEIDANLRGFDALEKALGKFSERTERQVAVTGLRAGGRAVIKYATQNAPVDDGLLADRKSWMSKAGRYHPGHDIGIKVGTKGGKKFAWYAHLVEFGTAKAKAHPFFRPAFDEHPTDIISAVAAAMSRSIVRAVKQSKV